MVKNFSSAEFADYVSGLKFTDIRDVVAYADTYKNHYIKVVDDSSSTAEDKADAFLKYSITMAVLGGYILKFCNNVFEELDKNENYEAV